MLRLRPVYVIVETVIFWGPDRQK